MSTTAEQSLWCACLWLSAYDYYGRNGADELIQEDAREWFYSKSEDIGSFLWITNMLGLDAGRLRQRLLEESKPQRPQKKRAVRRAVTRRRRNLPPIFAGEKYPWRRREILIPFLIGFLAGRISIGRARGFDKPQQKLIGAHN